MESTYHACGRFAVVRHQLQHHETRNAAPSAALHAHTRTRGRCCNTFRTLAPAFHKRKNKTRPRLPPPRRRCAARCCRQPTFLCQRTNPHYRRKRRRNYDFGAGLRAHCLCFFAQRAHRFFKVAGYFFRWDWCFSPNWG